LVFGNTNSWSGDRATTADTDVSGMEEGYVAVTPLQFNLTHEVLLRQMSEWEWRL
jgi:broad specificity polyphosphatase/5'/3'-nucleotidase SurE